MLLRSPVLTGAAFGHQLAECHAHAVMKTSLPAGQLSAGESARAPVIMAGNAPRGVAPAEPWTDTDRPAARSARRSGRTTGRCTAGCGTCLSPELWAGPPTTRTFSAVFSVSERFVPAHRAPRTSPRSPTAIEAAGSSPPPAPLVRAAPPRLPAMNAETASGTGPEPDIFDAKRLTADPELAAEFTASAHRILADLVRGGAPLGWVDPPPADEVAELVDRVLRAARSGDGALRAAYAGGRLIGLGYWLRYARPTNRQHADLEKLAVAPEAHGRGVGRSLTSALVEDARVRGSRSSPWTPGPTTPGHLPSTGRSASANTVASPTSSRWAAAATTRSSTCWTSAKTGSRVSKPSPGPRVCLLGAAEPAAYSR